MLAIGLSAQAQPAGGADADDRFQSWVDTILSDQTHDFNGQALIESPNAARAGAPSPTLQFLSNQTSELSGRLQQLATASGAANIYTGARNSVVMHACDGETQGVAHRGCRCNCDRWRLFGRCGAFKIEGWLQAGVLFNTDNRYNSPVLFNDRANEFLLNQLNFAIEKPVAADGRYWDIGGRVDLMYGTDSRFLAVPGLENHRDDTPRWNSETSRYGLALPQAYVEIAAPVRPSLSVKLGHFYSISGFESFPTPYNYFYSVPYSMAYGLPFTHTGALMTYRPTSQLTVQLGYTEGWDVLSSEADTYGILSQLFFISFDRRTAISATTIAGRDVTGVVAGTPLSNDRVLVDLVVRHCITDRLKCAVQADIGYQKDGEVVVTPGPSLLGFDSAKWGGITSYLIYDHSPDLTSAFRLEWFDDADQSRLGIPVTFVPGGPTFTGGNYFALTAGLNWRPNTNVTVRPELRWDYSDLKGSGAVPGGDPSLRAYDTRSDSDQVTVGADLIVFF